MLSANLLINGLRHVSAERAALGTAPGSINVPFVDLGRTENFGGVSVGGETGERCPVVTLDSYELPAARLIKVDVEGAEAQVLGGARDTIRRLRPFLYVENDRKEKSAELIALIMEMDYRLWWHVAPLYNPRNHRGDANNIFGRVASLNMLCVPRELGMTVNDAQEILSPDAPSPF